MSHGLGVELSKECFRKVYYLDIPLSNWIFGYAFKQLDISLSKFILMPIDAFIFNNVYESLYFFK